MAERFGVHEVANLTLIDLQTNKPVLFLNSLKMTNFESKADIHYAVGGQGGGRILSWDSNRTGTLTVQNALFDPNAFALQSGTPMVTGATAIFKREVLTFDAAGVVTLAQSAITNTITVYNTTDGRSHGTEIASGTASVTNYAATTSGTPAVTKLTTAAGNANKQVIVYYQFMSTVDAMMITIDAMQFPSFYRVIGDTVVRNESTGKDEPFQIVIPKAKLMPNFKFDLQPSGDPTVFDFDMELYKDGNQQLMSFIKYS